MTLLYEQESYKIRGAVFEVYKQLGARHKEIVYQRALLKALSEMGLKIDKEKQIPVLFNGQKVGSYAPDIIVNDKIIIELKAKSLLTKYDIQQFWQYLVSTEYKLGFLINFGKTGGVEIIRKVYDIACGKSQKFTQNNTGKNSNIPRLSASDSAFFRANNGYITLISILIVSAIGVAIVVSLLLLGLGSSRTSFAIEQSNQAKQLTNACAEEALQQIRDFTPYTGTGNLAFEHGVCDYTVTSQGAQNRAIISSGAIGIIIRKVKIIIDKINPTINIVSWQEIADF